MFMGRTPVVRCPPCTVQGLPIMWKGRKLLEPVGGLDYQLNHIYHCEGCETLTANGCLFDLKYTSTTVFLIAKDAIFGDHISFLKNQ